MNSCRCAEFPRPAQNLLYADTQGNIAIKCLAMFPSVRRVMGVSLSLVGLVNTTGQAIFPSTNCPTPSIPARVTLQGLTIRSRRQVIIFHHSRLDYGYRANRIVNLLKNSPGKIDIAYIEKMQGDMYDADAETFAPKLLALQGNCLPISPRRLTCSKTGTIRPKQIRLQPPSSKPSGGTAARHVRRQRSKEVLADGGSRWNEVMRNLRKIPTIHSGMTYLQKISSRMKMIS